MATGALESAWTRLRMIGTIHAFQVIGPLDRARAVLPMQKEALYALMLFENNSSIDNSRTLNTVYVG